MNWFDEKMRAYKELVEADLSRRMAVPEGAPYKMVVEAMRYSLLSGGKRVRGVMTLAMYALFDRDVEKALPFASAVEMIHAYSLIHDDLPCMDDDDMRRGKNACHVEYGEAVALLAGDGLLTFAFETALSAYGFTPQQMVNATRCLAEAAGMHGMIGGQMMDLDNEGRILSEEELDNINRRKTGALLKACAGMACALADAREEQTRALRRYASAVGLAFQIRDDLLDVTADEHTLGKPVGSDARAHKQTYVAVYGQQQSEERIRALNAQAKAALEKLDTEDVAFLQTFADRLATRDS